MTSAEDVRLAVAPVAAVRAFNVGQCSMAWDRFYITATSDPQS
jgi:hypothetical protein